MPGTALIAGEKQQKIRIHNPLRMKSPQAVVVQCDKYHQENKHRVPWRDLSGRETKTWSIRASVLYAGGRGRGMDGCGN